MHSDRLCKEGNSGIKNGAGGALSTILIKRDVLLIFAFLPTLVFLLQLYNLFIHHIPTTS